MIIPKYEQIKRNATEKYCENNFPEFHKYINEKYINFNISFKEKLYWYYNGLTCYPTCKICGNRVNFHRFCDGYYSTCSSRCANIISQEKAKQTCLERYGVEHPKKSSVVNEKTKQTCLERYGVSSFTKTNQFKEKTKRTCLGRYGVEYYLQSDDYDIKNRSTRLKRYGDENYRNSEKAKQTCLERYGVENPGCREVQKINNTINKDIIQQKIYQTKKKNKTFNSSKIEKQFEAYLKENNINYKTQYKSEVYPFNCDFYFPDSDLYLEINAHWTHGGHPFDNTNKDDLLLLEQWKKRNTKFYDIAINTWTVRDVLKRETAKKNNLNYLEVFTDNIEDLIKNKKYMKSLVEQIKESLVVEAQNYSVIADEPNNPTDYIKLVGVDENAEPVDEFGFMEISQIKNPKDDKWVSEVGKMCKKHFGLSRDMSVSILFFDEENEGDWVQFAVVDGTGDILMWSPESLECDNPFS